MKRAATLLPSRVEDLYRTLAAGLPGGMAVIVDHDLRYLLADGEGLAVAGLSAAALEGKTIFEALPAGFAEQYEPSFRQALTGKPFVGENHSYGHDYLTHGVPLFNEAGEVYAVLAVSYDVTQPAERAWAVKERARAEADLRRSEDRFRQLVTTVSDFVFQMSPDWSETHSLSTSELLDEGLDPSLPWIDTYIPEPDRNTVRDAIGHAIATKGIFELEHRALQPDGSVGWAFSRAIPLLDDDGEILEWFGASSLTTARKSAEEALRASDERYRHLFTTMQEGLLLGEVVRSDDGTVDLRFTEVNPGYERIAGVSRDEVVGRLASAATPGLEEHWYQAVARAGLGGETLRLEEYAERFGKWLDVSYFPAGEPGDGRVAIIVSDISKRKEAEDALRHLNETLEQQVEQRSEELQRSELRFRQAFQAGPMAAAILSVDEERFLNVNAVFLRLTGYQEDEVIGSTAAELHMWSDAADRAKLRGAIKESGSGYQELELVLRTKEGLVRDILASGEVIRLDDREGRLMLFIDITVRKRTEEDLMKAIEAVMSDTSWFGSKVIERLTSARSGVTDNGTIDKLSPREREVLGRIARGLTNDQIADDLGIARKTISNHVANVYGKLGVNSRAQAVVWARERGIVG